MTISIHHSNAALAAAEALAARAQPTGSQAAGGAAAATSLSLAQSKPNASSVISVSSAAGLSGLSASLSTSASITDAAVAAGSQITTLLTQMRSDAEQAAKSGVSDQERAALNAKFQGALQQIQGAVASAKVSDVNLIDGSVQASGAALTGTNLKAGGPLIGLSANASLSDASTAASLADQLGAAIGTVGKAVSQIAQQGDAIQSNLALVAQAGLSSASSAPLDSDGAKLAALQVQQQLSLSSGAIGNQSHSAILALFR
jgi:epidermal growth factor receptor substrate 15